MTRAHALIAIIGVVVLASAVSSQQRPNFSGRWVTVSPAQSAGQEQVVTHDATSLATEHASEGAGHRAVYKLDGTESRNTLTSHGSEIVTTAKASWTGDQLTIKSATTYPDGRRSEQTQTWSMDAEGRLIIDVTSALQGRTPTTVRAVYTRR